MGVVVPSSVHRRTQGEQGIRLALTLEEALFCRRLRQSDILLDRGVRERACTFRTLANSASSNEQSRLFSNWRISSLGGKRRGRGGRGGERRKGGAAQGVQGRRKPQNRPDGLRWARNLTSSRTKASKPTATARTSANEHNVCHIAHNMNVQQQPPCTANKCAARSGQIESHSNLSNLEYRRKSRNRSKDRTQMTP